MIFHLKKPVNNEMRRPNNLANYLMIKPQNETVRKFIVIFHA
ncbi:hypothetical protein BH23THE1_BH23THE1_00120 [soil metagenome]